MLSQNDSRARAQVREYGCYLYSLVWWGWYLGGLELDAEFINESLYPTFVKRGWMAESCFVQNPVAMLNFMKCRVGHVVKEAADYKPTKRDIAVVGQWKADGGISHFVAMNHEGCVVYDPWYSQEGGSRAVREGQLQSYRIFRR